MTDEHTGMDRVAWDERYDAAPLVWSAEPNRFVVAETSDLPAGRALDVACGEGRNAIWLAERGWTVTGVDFSRRAIDKARQWAATRGVDGTWAEVDVTSGDLPGGPYDLVLVLYLQLPSVQRAQALAASASVLAVGGTLLVVAHDATNLTEGWGGPRDPSVLYSPDDVVHDLAAARGGPPFVVQKAERVERRVDTPDGPQVAIDALVRVVRAGGSDG